MTLIVFDAISFSRSLYLSLARGDAVISRLGMEIIYCVLLSFHEARAPTRYQTVVFRLGKCNSQSVWTVPMNSSASLLNVLHWRDVQFKVSILILEPSSIFFVDIT